MMKKGTKLINLYGYPYQTIPDFTHQRALMLEKETNKEVKIGLLNGLAGNALYFFEYSRLFQVDKYEELGFQLIEKIINKIQIERLPFDYASGIIGFGVCIEYLIRNEFLSNNPDELLSDIDAITFDLINLRIIFSTPGILHGISGIGYYYFWRLHSRKETSKTLHIKEFLIYLIDWLESLYPIKYEEVEEVKLFLNLLKPDCFYQTKVEKLLNELQKKSENEIYKPV